MFRCLGYVGTCGKQIEYIDKRHSKLEHVPEDVIRSFRTLEECRLDANQIRELPKNFFRLERLRYLSLSDNDISEIPQTIGKFSALVELDISRNDISGLPNSIRFCTSLQILDISNNPIQSLPTGLCQLSKLRVLCMNDISLSALPAEFGNLRSLTKCELRDNRLCSLPASFANLRFLEFLDLGANEFKDMPPLLGELTSLTELWMDDNELQSMPPELGQLERLQQLDVSENMLGALPEEIAGLCSLCDLNLSQNNLNCLPNSIGELRKLTVLKLNQNQLLSLTPSIGSCYNLQELYLTENFLSVLPETIGSLESMFLLNVDQNQISELPVTIGSCTSLNILSLRENLLRRLPNEIGNCSRLRVLDVSGNRLDRLPLTLANCPLTALWLSANQSQPVVTLQRDVDELTREEFLTCYLLPQDQLSSPGELDATMSPSEIGSLTGPQAVPVHMANGPDAIPAEPNEAYEPAESLTSHTAQARWSDHQRPSSVTSSTSSTRTPSVALSPTTFYGPPKGKQPPTGGSLSVSPRASVQSSDVESLTAGSSSRVHFSPGTRHEDQKERTSSKGFPKTRYPKSNRKAGDHREDRLSTELFPHDYTPKGSAANSPSGVSPRQETPVGALGEARLASAESWRTSNGSTRCPSAGDGNTPLKTFHFPTEDDNYHERVHDALGDDHSKSPPHVKPRNKVVTLGPTETINDSHAYSGHKTCHNTCNEGDLPFADDDTRDGIRDDADGDDAYSSGGEEISVITRRVGFSEDVEDNEEKSNQKLIRRDTPHYTKRARIQSKTAEGVDSVEAVMKILEKYHGAVSNYSVNSSSPQNAPTTTVELLKATQTSSEKQASPKLTEQEQTLKFNILRQPGSGLGLSIAGGVKSIPFRGTDHGIFVSRLNPNGLAFTSGLRLNDKIIEVNGISLVGVEHHVAVTALRANTNQFRIVVTRSPSMSHPAGSVDKDSTTIIRCTLQREPTGLGFSIVGGQGSSPSSFDPKAITISRIIEGGAAYKSGILQVGDQLVKVNGIDVRDARHDYVIALLTAPGLTVDLEVVRPSAQSQGNGFTRPSSVSPARTQATLLHSPSSPAKKSSVLLRRERGLAVERFTLPLNGGPLGLAIYGGSDINCLPFGGDEPGVFISKISPNGAAEKAGLCIGDRIVRVNNVDIRTATHDEAVKTLVAANKDPLILEVRRDPAPSGLRHLTIDRLPGQRFGLRIAGGIPSSFSNATQPPWLDDGSVFVTWIAPDGAVGLDGRLKTGDRLLEVNGHWIMGSTLPEALEAFRNAGSSLSLLVCDGFSELIANGQLAFNVRQHETGPDSPNVSDHLMAGSTVDHQEENPAPMISTPATNNNSSTVSHPGFLYSRTGPVIRDF